MTPVNGMIVSCSASPDAEREVIVLDSFWRGMADGPKQGPLRQSVVFVFVLGGLMAHWFFP